MFKIRAKTVLKINWSVKTPRMEVARSGLWAPDRTTFRVGSRSSLRSRRRKG